MCYLWAHLLALIGSSGTIWLLSVNFLSWSALKGSNVSPEVANGSRFVWMGTALILASSETLE